jgi:ABC-type branched-subunit amino acid transport system substrate-binding protein
LVSTPEQTWTVPGLPSYTVEAGVLAQAAISAGVKSVAIISQNDDFGKAYVASLTDTLEAAGVSVVEQVTYDVGAPTVDTEVSTMAASKADAAFVAALGTKCPQIINGIKASGWDPLLMVGTLCTSKALLGLLENGAGDGMLSTAWYKSPGDAQWADDPGLATYRESLAKYTPEADPNEDFVLTGWLWAQLFVEVLKSADTLDRAAVMEAARNADYHVDTMLDGIQFQTGPTRFDPVTALQVVRYDQAGGNLQFIDPATGDDLQDGTTSLITAGDSE